MNNPKFAGDHNTVIAYGIRRETNKVNTQYLQVSEEVNPTKKCIVLHKYATLRYLRRGVMKFDLERRCPPCTRPLVV